MKQINTKIELIPDLKVLREQSCVKLMKLLEAFIPCDPNEALIISQNDSSTHLVLVKQNSSIEVAITGSPLSDEKIHLIKGVPGFASFKIIGENHIKNSTKYVNFKISNSLTALTQLVKILYVMNLSSDNFLIKTYKKNEATTAGEMPTQG
jgi:hypothetical protein